MTEEQKQLVQESFAKIEPVSETAANLFYNKLFQIDPSLKIMFKGDLNEQGLKLMNMLGIAVRSLDKLDELTLAVKSLGRRHSGYGVKERHYDIVADALLWTLEQGLGKDFNEETKDAWVEVYTLLSQTMIESVSQHKQQESAATIT